jgi:hypothetical protein
VVLVLHTGKTSSPHPENFNTTGNNQQVGELLEAQLFHLLVISLLESCGRTNISITCHITTPRKISTLQAIINKLGSF